MYGHYRYHPGYYSYNQQYAQQDIEAYSDEWYGLGSSYEPPASSQLSDYYGHAQEAPTTYAYNPAISGRPAGSQYREQHSIAPQYGLYQHQLYKKSPVEPLRAPRAMQRQDQQRERVQERAREPEDRSLTPPPAPSPSPQYLALAKEAPATVQDPSRSRKLLILDLNGTLVFRSPHTSRPKYRPQDRGVPRLRPTYPRPYMQAFREYLFAPQTKAWLDVMVWSSAQPHSVSDMVEKCFGEKRSELVAVWARDTLGLSENHYHQKVQTLKDLNRPWSSLPALLAPLPCSPHSSEASTPRSSPTPEHPQSPQSDKLLPVQPASSSSQVHSALTTLLLDDSPKKATMQPYNHFCIPEYTQERRQKDMESFQKEQDWARILETRKRLQEQSLEHRETKQEAIASAVAPPQEEVVESAATSKKRKRKNKEEANGTVLPATGAEEATFSSSPSSSSHTEEATTAASEPDSYQKHKEKYKTKRQKKLEDLALAQERTEEPPVAYDETLLAVLGVLGEVRRQKNVAAWIRAGGLWGPVGAPEHMKTVSSLSLDGEAEPESAPESEAGESAGAPTKKRKPRHRTLRRLEAEAVRRAAEAEANGCVGVPAGNDAVTAAVPPTNTNTGVDDVADAPELPVASMWFEDTGVLEYWAWCGRKTLMAMGISIEHGIGR